MKDSLRIELMERKVLALQTSIDSLKQSNSLKQLEFELVKKQDIISQINDFYDSAWLKLVIVISIIGVLIPILVQFFQSKNLKDLAKFIEKQMNNSFESKIKELQNSNKSEIDKAIAELKSNIRQLEHNLTSQVEGGLFFLQGKDHFNKKKYTIAIKDFIRAALEWVNTDKKERTLSALNNVKKILKLIKSDQELSIVDMLLQKSVNRDLVEVIEYLKNHEHSSLYFTSLEEIKLEIDRIKKEVVS